MTKRQLTGFAITIGLMLGLMFAYWLSPIIGYTFRLEWVFVIGSIIAFGWAEYYGTAYAKKK